MAARRFAWVLNLDADLELAAPQGYSPKKSVREAMTAFVPLLARSLLGPDDLLVDETSPPSIARGLPGRAFCPTPRALAILRGAGADPGRTPSVDVLRRVNSRSFSSGLGPTLPGAAFVTRLADAGAKLAGRPPVGSAWRVKRAFGMSGRGQRVVASGHPTAADLAFVRGGMNEGGVQIEPNVAIAKEYAIHGMLAEDGSCRFGAAVTQRCDAHGAWLSTALLDVHGSEDEAVAALLLGEAKRVAQALAGEGYFGPFGIDAFAYRLPDQSIALQLCSEINARFSMGFAVGFGRDG